MSKHTPGLWHTDWLDEDHGWILDAEGNYLFEVVLEDDAGRCVSRDEAGANLRLAAAAPRMYAALDLLLQNMSDRGESHDDDGNEIEEYRIAREAFAKATEGPDEHENTY